jgi:hypothetical protein
MTIASGSSSNEPETRRSPRLSVSLARRRVVARCGPERRGQSGGRRPHRPGTAAEDPEVAATGREASWISVQLIRSELGSHPFTPCIPAEMEGGCNGDQSRRRSFGMHDLSHAGDNRVGAIEGPIAVTFSRRGPDQLRAGPASEGSIGGRRAPGTLECDGVATATANREIGRHSVGGSDRRGRRCNRRIGATDSQQR